VTPTPQQAAASKLVAFTAPSRQVMEILDAAETVRIRLLLLSATSGDQHGRQLRLLAGELRALGQSFRDPALDGRLSRLGSALGLMAEAFRNPGPELAGWCNNVLEVPPRRLARHLDVLAGALFVTAEAERPQPGSAYDPLLLDRWLGPQLDRARIAGLKSAPLPRRRW
jgi:hypothetical protein